MDPAELRKRARATWAAGDCDGFSKMIAPVGAVFAAAGADAAIACDPFAFAFASEAETVEAYCRDFGPAVVADYYVITVER